VRILLDTTYVLSAIGVSVKGVPRDAVEQLIARGDEIFISEISLFELSAKGARYVFEGSLPPERVTRGINAISYDDSITKLRIYETSTLHLALKLRAMLGDFIDCLIVASAADHCEILVTEDDEIHRLKREKGFEELMIAAGSRCKVVRLAEVLHSQNV
jgi:predicted nucleic acid-binding protein